MLDSVEYKVAGNLASTGRQGDGDGSLRLLLIGLALLVRITVLCSRLRTQALGPTLGGSRVEIELGGTLREQPH